MSRNVLIDIDNTLTKLDYTLRQIEDYFGVPEKGVEDISSFNLASVYDIPKEKHIDFWLTREENIVKNSELNEKIYQEILNELEEDDTIYIVTARDNSLCKETKKWLDKHIIKYDHLECIGKNKSKIDWLKENNLELDLIFEDNGELLEELNDSIKKVIIDYPYNRQTNAHVRLIP